MCIIKIKVFPASYGESFLVTCEGNNKTNILVDMGFESTYSNHIREQLMTIAKQGEKLSLLVFTHTDEDHICGGIKFLEENGHESETNVIGVEEIWYNSFRHLQFRKREKKELSNDEKMILQRIISRGHPKELYVTSRTDISSKQGSTLASLIYENGYTWNRTFNGKAIVADCNRTSNIINLNDEVRIIVLSPTLDKLRLLDTRWEHDLKLLGYNTEVGDNVLFDDAFEFWLTRLDERKRSIKSSKCSYKVEDIESIIKAEFEEDCSLSNGSSIAFVLEFYNKRILFLGDAHPSIVLESLHKHYPNIKDKLYFDAIKVSHHASKFNTSPQLLDLVYSSKYIISTNGMKHIHPDIETILRIISANKNFSKELVFNYKPDKYMSSLNGSKFKKEYMFDICYINEFGGNKVGTVVIK